MAGGRLRRALWVLGVLVLAGAAVLALWLAPYTLRVERFAAAPEKGYHASFDLYLSPGARRGASQGLPVRLLVQPADSGRTSDDPEVHRREAWWMGFERHGIADELGLVLLVPAFVRPASDWQVDTHALDRDSLTTGDERLARPDLQLLAMIESARAALADRGIASEEKVLLCGFSASGMFANRFTALHPERVLAVAAGSPGGWPIAPVAEVGGERLPYPAGVADLEQLTGRPFDLEAWRAVPQLLYRGSLDDDDSVDFRDGWDEPTAAQIDRLFGAETVARWPVAERLYREAGADARFALVDGVGHDRRALEHLAVRFLSDQSWR